MAHSKGVEIQIKQVAVIARCQFDTTCQYIISVFDPLVAHYTAMLASGAVDPNNPQYLVLDGKLTWLMFVLGAVVGTSALHAKPLHGGRSTVDSLHGGRRSFF